MPLKTEAMMIRLELRVNRMLRDAAELECRSIANMVEVLVLKHCEAQNIPIKKNSGKKNG